ncbi:hypothetical protein Pan216_30090 [Planctomycetes bacterium Pan216]|uniref:Uncharacterized protein n=1 Tax=Kolteria novifilia TaxID=2527975 RepID=A0A518B5B5_9BACT|nr:hypothetical protein Pan216_30090 [Planctomycetes bacterium Pan216]
MPTFDINNDGEVLLGIQTAERDVVFSIELSDDWIRLIPRHGRVRLSMKLAPVEAQELSNAFLEASLQATKNHFADRIRRLSPCVPITLVGLSPFQQSVEDIDQARARGKAFGEIGPKPQPADCPYETDEFRTAWFQGAYVAWGMRRGPKGWTSTDG